MPPETEKRLRKTAVATFYMYILFLIYHIYSLFKKYINSCNAKLRRQRRRTVKNNNRFTQQKSNFARAAHFFVHFFAVVLNDYNVKLPQTSQLHALWRKCRTCSRSLFFTAAHFQLALVAASISYFLPAATKLSCCSCNKKNVSFVVYLSLQISVALFLVELRWHAAYFLFLYFPNFGE